MDINHAKRLVLKAGIKLVESGLIARTWGNVSCRVDRESFIITPSGRSYLSLAPTDLVRVKIRDLSYAGESKPSSEKGIHAEVYKLDPDVNFVIHTHQDNASVIAATGLSEIEIGDEYPALGGAVICADYALPGTKGLCKKVQKALARSKGKAVIMKHHGALCFGRDAEEVFMVASELERACADFIRDHYLRQSKEPEYDPAAMCGFILGQNCKTRLPNLSQQRKSYGHSRRSEQGFIWYNGKKEVEIIHDRTFTGLPEEAGIYHTIYNNHKRINQIIFITTPEIIGLSTAGLTLKPLLDDFAQIVGLRVKTVTQDEPEKISQALNSSAAVLIKNVGALCSGQTREDATAVGMVLQKACKAWFGASLFGKVKPINLLESALMRYVYLKKYSNLFEPSTSNPETSSKGKRGE